jgi:hypothetical protein
MPTKTKTKKPVKKKTAAVKHTRASAVRKKTLITKRPTAPPKELKAVPDPKPKKPEKPPGLVYYSLEGIKKFQKSHPNHNAAVEALTQAFSEGKRLAIRDTTGVTPDKFPQIWISMSDYVEIDGKVIKDRNGI